MVQLKIKPGSYDKEKLKDWNSEKIVDPLFPRNDIIYNLKTLTESEVIFTGLLVKMESLKGESTGIFLLIY